MNICVFCGSSEQVSETYHDLAREVGRRIGTRGDTLVYGGGICGLMGQTARGAHEAGARVIGVYPTYFSRLAPDFLDERITCRDLRERKALMESRTDAFLALPGGVGTLDEVFDLLAPKSLHKLTHPIVLLNHLGYYDELLQFLRHVVKQQFMKEDHLSLLHAAAGVEEAFAYIDSYVPTFSHDDLWPDD